MTARVVYDALIIGGGPAGSSAALALGRVMRTAMVFDSGAYRNLGVAAMHTVLSRDGMNPREFGRIGREQIESKYKTISFCQNKIVEVSRIGIDVGYTGFRAVDDNMEEFFGRKLILATGTEDVFPTDIEGYQENWPAHIYQCLFCDGYEDQGRPVGLLTFSSPADEHLALMALRFSDDVTIYSNGEISQERSVRDALETVKASGVKVDPRTVKKLINEGEEGISIQFHEGPTVTLGMLVHKPTVRNRAQDLINQLGLKMADGSGEVIAEAPFQQTNVPGCFVAGDTADVIKQVTVAMAAGLRAAAGVVVQLTKEEGLKALER